jgi:hypothetical protein
MPYFQWLQDFGTDRLGTIVRCPRCDYALIRLAHSRGRHWLDLRGIRHLQVETVAG